MPFRYEELVTPMGRPYVRVHVSGDIDLRDAEEYVARFEGAYQRRRVLSVVASGTEYSAKARKHLLAMRESSPHATVTTSALVRAAIHLMTRSAAGGTYRVFTDEPEALAWLDDQEA
ncbi:STAS/SEC14 domain-containing protein [Nannocystis bainbridge]|uniref:STAS/SEC14 domain-containing protein n=1 Tax=Nannocystis bainbridge TaxID=2995303 RepID=A0ABT5E8T0_9BACT|nr:STAS/SEC14 domain-containing protein [Nannocystis bainbridge]MDC0722275.1 STAS/SEC14 domain-containing protein [Nannocystis bainbridge]